MTFLRHCNLYDLCTIKRMTQIENGALLILENGVATSKLIKM